MIESQMDEYDDRDGLDTRSGALAGGVRKPPGLIEERRMRDKGKVR